MPLMDSAYIGLYFFWNSCNLRQESSAQQSTAMVRYRRTLLFRITASKCLNQEVN